MISTRIYIWPEHGDVEYFLSKFARKGADCRLLSDKETLTADIAMLKIE